MRDLYMIFSFFYAPRYQRESMHADVSEVSALGRTDNESEMNTQKSFNRPTRVVCVSRTSRHLSGTDLIGSRGPERRLSLLVCRRT